MPKKNIDRSNKTSGIIIIFAIVIVATITGLWLWLKQKPEPDVKNLAGKVHLPVKHQNIIDYNKLDKDNKLKALIRERKAKCGIDKGLDIIVKSDESLKIGDTTVSMQEILDKIRLKRGEVVEKDIQSGRLDQKNTVTVFGIYVVQPGDNIWNIHFKFLKDYFNHKGISLSPLADEPDSFGFSSGVGKILKFSENIVHIYNLTERKLDTDINLIHPLSKIVVYNMHRIFALLDQIDYERVNHIQFDGETLWISVEQ